MLKKGDLVQTKSITARIPARNGGMLQVGFKANKGQTLCFIFLGAVEDGEEFDAEAALRSLGWIEKPQAPAYAPIKSCTCCTPEQKRLCVDKARGIKCSEITASSEVKP